jgi:hypothetical protein
MRFINSAMTLMGRKTVKGRTTSAPKTAKSTAVPADVATTASMPADAPPARSGTTTGVTTASAQRPKSAPSHEDIARRSYEIYLARGGEEGHAEEDWLAAERELSASH